MSTEPRLTLAIPYYSGKEYLVRAVESVRRQTRPDWNLVVCDDSPGDDDVGSLLAAYGDRRLAYVKNPARLGIAGNWNNCLARATADLATILHGDDELLPDYVELMLRAAADHPRAAGLFCETTIIGHAGRPVFSVPDVVKRFLRPASDGPLVLEGREAVRRLLRGNFIMCPTMCYRRSVLGARRFDSRWQFVLDFDLFLRLLFDGESLVGLPQRAYAYRRHDASATAQQTKNLGRFREESRIYDEVAATARARDWPEVAQVAAKKRIIRLNLLCCILRDVAGLRGGDARKKLQFLRGLA